MSSVENTRAGSFKGAPMRIDEVSVKEGTKRVKYVYLNSNRRTQKELLQWPPEFTVKCHTYGSDGATYEQARDRLREALKSTEPGNYVDAWLGNNNCASDVYTFKQSYKESNKCYFDIVFTTYTDDKQQPFSITGTVNTVNSLALNVSRGLQDASGLSMAGTTYEQIEQKKSFFENVAGFLPSFGSIGVSIQQVSDYAEQALQIKEQSELYANNPLLGLAKISDTIFGIDGLTTDAFAKFDACQTLFDWGDSGENDNDIFISESTTTSDNAQAYVNRETQKTFIQTSGLLEAYKQSVRIDFQTSEEIDIISDALDEQFEKTVINLNKEPLFLFNFSDVVLSQFYDTYIELNKLRNQAKEFFQQKGKSARRVEEITIKNPMPASVLSYTLYGDSSHDTEIMELNGLFDNMSVSGTIKVYSDV